MLKNDLFHLLLLLQLEDGVIPVDPQTPIDLLLVVQHMMAGLHREHNHFILLQLVLELKEEEEEIKHYQSDCVTLLVVRSMPNLN